METLKRLYERFKQIDKKKRTYLLAGLAVVFVMGWAFLSAALITANYTRAQLKGTPDEQKVDAEGIIITETKDGNKYFEIYGESLQKPNKKGSITPCDKTITNWLYEFSKNNLPEKRAQRNELLQP